jgi:hypothetical protein
LLNFPTVYRNKQIKKRFLKRAGRQPTPTISNQYRTPDNKEAATATKSRIPTTDSQLMTTDTNDNQQQTSKIYDYTRQATVNKRQLLKKHFVLSHPHNPLPRW